MKKTLVLLLSVSLSDSAVMRDLINNPSKEEMRNTNKDNLEQSGHEKIKKNPIISFIINKNTSFKITFNSKKRMKNYITPMIVALCLSGSPLAAETSTPQKEENSNASAEYTKYRVGGYGEMVASYLDYGYNRFTGEGSGSMNRATISIPRFVLAFDYKFTPKWILGAEIEFEYGGTGIAKEIEYSDEGGEYETEIEKGGEVALEQFHITRLFHRSFNVKVGHIIVPVGLTNAHHEPINFFGCYRPEGETTLLPSTWHENGIAFFGEFGRGATLFDYEAQVVAGLNPNGFRKQDWISQGKQGAFEINNFSCPALVGRLNYHGVRGMRVGVSAYYCANTGKNSDRPDKIYDQSEEGNLIKAPVTILTADAQYKSKNIIARGNVVWGNLGESVKLYNYNKTLSNKSGYSRSAAAKRAVSYAAEAGYNIGSFFGEKAPRIFPFARYEYYNPQEKTEKGMAADERFQTDMWTVGANYYPLPNLVIKADYSHRSIGKGKYTSENEFSVGLAYVGWFFQK